LNQNWRYQKVELSLSIPMDDSRSVSLFERRAVSTSPTRPSIHFASLHVDNLCYKHDGKAASCLWSLSPEWHSPRRFLAVDGFVVEIHEMEDPDHESILIDHPGGICIPCSVERLGRGCLRRCSSRAIVAFECGSKLLGIDNFAFSEGVLGSFIALSSICIPASVERVGDCCFQGCPLLSTVTFESGSRLAIIGKDAFLCCSALSSICIPSSVERLPYRCFEGCESLYMVTFESDSHLSSIGDFAFSQCTFLSVFAIPPRLRELGKFALGHVNLREISVATGNRHFKMVDEFLMYYECASIKKYCGPGNAVTIPASLETFEVGCFAEYETIWTVRFEPGPRLSSMGESSFSNCWFLSSSCIPSSVESLGENCFCDCESLSSVTFESDSKLSCLGRDVFAACVSLSSSSLSFPSHLRDTASQYQALVPTPRGDEDACQVS
jgi:hypothetical protein